VICSLSQCVEVCRTTFSLRCVSVCCSVLQRVARLCCPKSARNLFAVLFILAFSAQCICIYIRIYSYAYFVNVRVYVGMHVFQYIYMYMYVHKYSHVNHTYFS